MTTPLLANILNQAESLRQVAAYQFGEGRDAIRQAAGMLRSRNQVLLSGMGASCFACTAFQHMLAKRGYAVTTVETAELLYFLPSSVTRDTTIVLVSRSGQSVEVTKLLDLLGSSGAPVLGVVNVPESPLSVRANCALTLGSPADQLVAIQTYTATLAVFAILDAALSDKLDEAKIELEKTIDLLADSIPQWVQARGEWRPFLESSAPLYVLGRGPLLGAVSEGVLLMHEVAKASGVGMSIPQFRHGPVEVVDSHFRAIVIGTQLATSDLDASLARDLTAMGGQVRWLGPAVKTPSFPSLCSWPDGVPERFASIFETIPLQIAAYAKAEINGVHPGDFRWAPVITTSEAGFTAQSESH